MSLMCDWCGELHEDDVDYSCCDCGREIDRMFTTPTGPPNPEPNMSESETTIEGIAQQFRDTIFWNYCADVEGAIDDPSRKECEYPLDISESGPDEDGNIKRTLWFVSGEVTIPVATVYQGTSDESAHEVDAKFIANLPTYIPALFREIYRLRAALTQPVPCGVGLTEEELREARDIGYEAAQEVLSRHAQAQSGETVVASNQRDAERDLLEGLLREAAGCLYLVEDDCQPDENMHAIELLLPRIKAALAKGGE